MNEHDPRLHHRRHHDELQSAAPPIQGAEVLSSLALQMLMYFNTLFSPVWLLLIVFATSQADFPFVFTDIIGLIIYTMLIPLEIVRLYLGHRGNLSESSPSLTSFIIASGIFELPLLLIAMLRSSMVAFEAIANSVLLIFLLSGIFLGLRAVAHLNRERTLRFQLLYQGMLHDELQDLDLPPHESRF